MGKGNTKLKKHLDKSTRPRYTVEVCFFAPFFGVQVNIPIIPSYSDTEDLMHKSTTIWK